MTKEMKWLDWAKEIQAIAQAGLAYTKDDFDRERFEQLREPEPAKSSPIIRKRTSLK